MLKRREIQVLRRVGHTSAQVATLTGVSIGTARRVAHDLLQIHGNAALRGAFERGLAEHAIGAE